MNKESQKNTDRRRFLKKMAASTVFVVPTIQSFSLLQTETNWWWTGHGHGHHHPPPPPPK